MSFFQYSSSEVRYVKGSESERFVKLDGMIFSKSELMEVISKNLSFPAYFGKNWDSLYDMLCDLSWIEEKNVTLFHSALPKISHDDLLSYINLLNDCCICWNERSSHIFTVVFSSADRKNVEKNLLS